MLTIGLFPNSKKSSINKILDSLIQYLQANNIRVVLPEIAAAELSCSELACSLEKIKSEISIAITLGGDGTLLSAARTLACAGIPILGINLGKLGFLAEVEVADIKESMQKIIAGDYIIKERSMLETTIIRNNERISVSSALNDAVITKGSFSRMIKLKLNINNTNTTKYFADGLIIATATGSTGYSLSAGGPIVHPELNVMVLTPICPHTLYARPMVIPEQEKVIVDLIDATDDIILTIDGQIVKKLQPGDQIQVQKSEFRAKFIYLNGKSYYEILRNKLWRDYSETGL